MKIFLTITAGFVERQAGKLGPRLKCNLTSGPTGSTKPSSIVPIEKTALGTSEESNYLLCCYIELRRFHCEPSASQI